MSKSTQFKKGIIPWNKGKKNVYSAAILEKMRTAQLGKKHGPMPEWHKDKLRAYVGRVFTEEHKNKIRQKLKGRRFSHMVGPNCTLWKGGFSPVVILLRACFKYRQWRSDIFTRDDFTCVHCYTKGGKLNAHHLKSFSEIVRENNIKTVEEGLDCEELWNVNNGITLCVECHKKTDNFAGKIKKTNKKLI